MIYFPIICSAYLIFLGVLFWGIFYGVRKKINPFRASVWERVAVRFVRLGFALLTLGIFLWLRWSFDRYGKFWSWSSKEWVWLLTWLLCFGMFHLNRHHLPCSRGLK